MFVILITYTQPLSQVDALLEAHVRWLDEQYAAGCFLASGRRIPRIGGVVLAVAESEEALRSILRHDPFLQHGVAEYEIIEFVPSKADPRLAFLLQKT